MRSLTSGSSRKDCASGRSFFHNGPDPNAFKGDRHGKVIDAHKPKLKVKVIPERVRSGYELLQMIKQAVDIQAPQDMTQQDVKVQAFDTSLGSSLVEKLFYDSVPRKHVEIECIEPVLRPELLQRFLRKVAEEDTIIEACWHGTQEHHVDPIVNNGLNPSLCATGAYGRGAYVGTHAGVAHQYADPNEDGWRHMFCILVVVGSSVVKGVEGRESAGVTQCDRLINPTQYCFVDEERLFCSHLVTYRVNQMTNRRTGGGWEDPFQRKLVSAVTRAAKRSRMKACARGPANLEASLRQ